MLGGRHFERLLCGRNGRRRLLEYGSRTRNHRRRMWGGRGGMGEEGEIEVRCEEPDGEQNCPRQRGCKKSQFPLAAAGSILWGGPDSRGGCLDIRRRPRVEHVCLWLHGRVCLRKIGHVCSAHGRSGMQLGSKGVVSGPIESAFPCFHFQNKPRDASRPWAGVKAASKRSPDHLVALKKAIVALCGQTWLCIQRGSQGTLPTGQGADISAFSPLLPQSPEYRIRPEETCDQNPILYLGTKRKFRTIPLWFGSLNNWTLSRSLCR